MAMIHDFIKVEAHTLLIEVKVFMERTIDYFL